LWLWHSETNSGWPEWVNFRPWLPDFSWSRIPKPEKFTKWIQNVPNEYKMYQMNTQCTKWTQNVPNGPKISQMFRKYSKWP
jgi:hypothetical protein